MRTPSFFKSQMTSDVFVRHYTGLQQTSGWADDDLSYMRSEGMAALLAWLHALDCTVVGRLSDDGWYRPRRPLPEWVSVLAGCGLPTPRVVVTNVADDATLERQWSGRARYQPLTSSRSYTIAGDGWAELVASCVWLRPRAFGANPSTSSARLTAVLFHELIHLAGGLELDAEFFENLPEAGGPEEVGHPLRLVVWRWLEQIHGRRAVLAQGAQYFAGYGKYFSRFLYLLPERWRTAVFEANTRLTSDLLAEVCGDAAFNAGILRKVIAGHQVDRHVADQGP